MCHSLSLVRQHTRLACLTLILKRKKTISQLNLHRCSCNIKPVESQGATNCYIYGARQMLIRNDTGKHLYLKMSVAPYPINEEIIIFKT